MNKLRPSWRSVRQYSQERLKSRNGACSWDRTGEQEKERSFWENISFGKKMEAVTHFKVLLSPLTDIESPRQTARNTGTVRIRLWWSSFRKSSLTGGKTTWELSWTQQEVNATHCQRGTQAKKITHYALHSPLAIFVLITSKRATCAGRALEVIKNVFTFYRAIDDHMSKEPRLKLCSGYFPYQ